VRQTEARWRDTLITYLEMRAPPGAPAVAAPTPAVRVVRAEAPTLSFYRYLYDTVGAPWLWTGRQFMDQDTLARILENPAVEIWVLWVAGVPGGLAELDRRRPPDIDLAYFGLVPDFIGKGYGRYFLAWTVRRAWSYGPRRLTVNTCTLDHGNALPNYERAGFRVYDRRPGRVQLSV
jgi:GNAT superfamily N-acetyltransferase